MLLLDSKTTQAAEQLLLLRSDGDSHRGRQQVSEIARQEIPPLGRLECTRLRGNGIECVSVLRRASRTTWRTYGWSSCIALEEERGDRVVTPGVRTRAIYLDRLK
ncbi:hypothetical protein BV898_05183 [Hypsibius exemplaris]|uniref:Uncharacterized protein n=1 Tax=Hypsibius exemplaris TaxID=2072580 RepID=A0A1W0X053_HYPEX|nr:hypothetical protein BV898_05183 [Hypsibius exemplaris]